MFILKPNSSLSRMVSKTVPLPKTFALSLFVVSNAILVKTSTGLETMIILDSKSITSNFSISSLMIIAFIFNKSNRLSPICCFAPMVITIISEPFKSSNWSVAFNSMLPFNRGSASSKSKTSPMALLMVLL